MKNSIKRIISFALMLSLLVGMMAGFSVFAAETETVEIISKNLYYGDTFNIMYAVNSTSDDVVLNIYTMNNDGELELAVTVDDYDTEDVKGVANAKVFTSAIGVPAQNIDKEFYVQAVAGNTKSKMVKYSVLEYLYERLTVSTDVEPEQATMYKSLLAFADAADVVVNKDTTTNIANYAYVRVTNGTVDGTNTAAMVMAGTALDKLTTTYVPETGKVLAWNVEENDLNGISSNKVYKDTVLKAGEFAVEGGKNYVLTPDSVDGDKVYKTYTYTFDTAPFTANETKNLGGVNWTATGDGGYWGKDSNGKGQQFGSSGKPCKTLTLTSDEFSDITKIVIETSGASSVNASFVVYVGDTLVSATATKLTSTSTKYTFDVSELTGEIKFVYTQTSSKALYVKSISVDYAE